MSGSVKSGYSQIQAFLDETMLKVFGDSTLQEVFNQKLSHIRSSGINIGFSGNEYRQHDAEITFQCTVARRHFNTEQLKMVIIGILYHEGFKVVSSVFDQSKRIEKILMYKEA